ncbi:hypothetical protein ACHAPT_013093 [Fusarium lateritium]
MGRFRALYTVLEDWSAARISGVGRRQQFEDVIPPDQSVNVDVSESTMDDGWVQIDLMKVAFGEKYPPDPPIIPQPLWGFPLHARCWDLVCATDARFQNPSTVQALFDICRSCPMQNGVLNWGHNYNGLVKYNVDVEKLFPGEEARLQEPELENGPHRCDPTSIPLCMSSPCHSPNGSDRNRYTDKGLKPHGSASSDPFGLLPPELLLDILVRSDSSSVANLRLASKAVANIGLPEKFWSSRFWPGYEFEHVFELAASGTAHGQWRFLYHKVRALQGNPAMKNRQRVWNLACQLRDWVILRLESPACYGSLCKSFFKPDGEDDGRKWYTAQPLICPGTSIFSAGSRSLYDSTITTPSQMSGAWASLVTLNGKSYVSGLRIAQIDGESLQLGYRHPDNEVAFRWGDRLEPSDPFAGFHVAMDARGIRGLRVLSTQGVSSCWVGDHETVPKKSIVCNAQLQAIKGGFDALKMVSISVPCLEDGQKKRKAASEKSALWYPELPDPALQIMEVQNERLSRHIGHVPYSMCLFGGNDGELLPHLTEIIVWIVDRSDLGIYADKFHVWALEFHYNSQKKDGLQSVILGKVPEPDPGTYERRRYQISINSPSGERINGVDTMYQDPRFPFALTASIHSLPINKAFADPPKKFHTSSGRSIQIPPDFSSAVPDDDFFIERLRPTKGIIIGFFSVLVSQAFM